MAQADEGPSLAEALTDEARESPMTIFIAVLAALLALISLVSDNVAEEEMQAHIEAANQFAFFQAKNIRATDSEIAAQMFEKLGHGAEAAAWGEKAKRYDAEKADILKAARAEQQNREEAGKRNAYFDAAIALLQIAIVLATASLLSRGRLLVVLSVGLAGIAGVLAANGYLLFVDVPLEPDALRQWLTAAGGA